MVYSALRILTRCIRLDLIESAVFLALHHRQGISLTRSILICLESEINKKHTPANTEQICMFCHV